MAVRFETLKALQRDYFLARWEDNQLTMEPFCYCGKELNEDYFCPECNHKCDCTFIACENPQTLSVVQKFIQSNPDFKKFEIALLYK